MEAIEFFEWCNTPMFRSNGELRLRVCPQFPEYNTYIIIDNTGKSVLPIGTFLTSNELLVNT